jgi:protein-S-isoprenylcysteine O-methyltransferase Ste14
MARRSARAAVQAGATTLAWIAAPFAGAGRLDWYRAWTCVALYSICMPALGIVVRRVNPAVFEARKKWLRPNTRRFDKVFLAAYLPLIFLQLVAAGLDVVRYRWSTMPFWLLDAGVLLLLLSLALIGWSLAVNRFAENSVRIQVDRGHTVVTAGPYRIVRHPMYVGAIAMYFATALILGSVWALIVAAAIGVLFVVRTTLEDRMLRAELPGYAEYAAQTRWRLLPAVW